MRMWLGVGSKVNETCEEELKNRSSDIPKYLWQKEVNRDDI
jgi:hypothetical protein